MLLGLLSNWNTLVYFIVALVSAITFHEFAHAWMANKLGDPTAKLSGRLNLNPLSHMDLIGTLMLLLAGFGWGRPVPYNPNYVRGGKLGETWIALSGPIMNIIIAFIFALPERIYHLTTGATINNNLFVFLSVMVSVNILLAAFNLIPIPPLDGSKLLYLLGDALFGAKFDWASFERIGPMILLGLIFAERLFNINIIFRVLEPIIFAISWIVGSTG